MINKERVMLLVDALRSGKYKQGKASLGKRSQDGEENCCLGVACEVAIENGLELDKEYTENIVFYDNEATILPNSVRKWYGFKDNNPELLTGLSYVYGTPATRVNDDYGYSFEKISKLFKKTYC